MCVFSLAKDREIDVQNYKQMDRRRESSERPRNIWWVYRQRSGDKEKLGQNVWFRQQQMCIREQPLYSKTAQHLFMVSQEAIQALT